MIDLYGWQGGWLAWRNGVFTPFPKRFALLRSTMPAGQEGWGI